jgi:tetratricopeptide (TPR) repeat protein
MDLGMQSSSHASISKSSRGRILFLILSLLFWILPALAQTQNARKPPVLIKDTDIAEGIEHEEEAEPKELNPLLAKENLEIGDFYYKRKNYRAAIHRYLEALEYQPDLIKAFEALARAYEKNDEIDKAIDTYKDFLEKYPDSPKVSDFRSKLANLEKESN